MDRFGGHTREELRQLDAAATPRPWWLQREYDGSRTVCQMRSVGDLWCLNRASHVEGIPYEQPKENGALISAARNALPDLLAYIAELEAKLAESERQKSARSAKKAAKKGKATGRTKAKGGGN